MILREKILKFTVRLGGRSKEIFEDFQKISFEYKIKFI